MVSYVKVIPSKFISIDFIVKVKSTQGYISICPWIGIIFFLEELIANTVAKLPPALSPQTNKLLRSILNSFSKSVKDWSTSFDSDKA